jgi:transposase
MNTVCEIFKCKKQSLLRWVNKYNDTCEIKRSNRKAVSYKITKDHVKYAVKMLKENEQITITELSKIIKKNIKILILHHNI